MAYFNKHHWVERSGTLLYIEVLQALFPMAKFVHMIRDGRDVALSSQRHNAWRLGLAWNMIEANLGSHPLYSSDRTQLERLPPELRAFLPEQFDRNAFGAFEVPLAPCGEYWAYQLADGLKVLSRISDDRLLNLRYEDFFVTPKTTLDTLANFIGAEFIDEDWSARCAATVRPPRSTWRNLSAEDACALTEACRPGFELLRAAGIRYDF
jgi:putative sulfotransferase